MFKKPPRFIHPSDPFYSRWVRALYHQLSSMRKPTLYQLLICLVLIAVSTFLFSSPELERFENLFFDYYFKYRPAFKAHPDIVLIEIAEDSLQGVGRWPWPRHYHAAMTHILKEYGARAIVFDILFSEPSGDFDDGAFEESLATFDSVYFPVVYESKGMEKSWIHTLHRLEQHAAGIGHINIEPDHDGTLRRIRPYLQYGSENYPHLALKIAYDFLKKPIPPLDALGLPLDSQKNFIINWTGKWKDTFLHYSYLDILKGYEVYTRGETPPIGPFEIKGKICIIGLTAFGHADIKANPLEPAYPAVGVHANVIDNILTERFVSRAPKKINALTTFAVSLIASLFFIQLHRVGAFLGGLLTGGLWIVVSYFVFRDNGLMLDTFRPIMTIFCLYVFSTLYAIFTAKIERHELFTLASRDGLTGLYNIRQFRMMLQRYYRESKNRKLPLSIILLDIDHFKNINDTYGHPIGDQVLKKIARIMETCCVQMQPQPNMNVLGRYGGEEFIILLRKCKAADAFFKFSEKIRGYVEATHFDFENDLRVPVTVSLGVAELEEKDRGPDSLIKRADKALYRAKEEGRNRSCLADPSS